MKKVDLTGRTYGRLKVLYELSEGYDRKYHCLCECGNTTDVLAGNLRRQTKSCGCLRLERVKEVATLHGMTRSRTHNSYTNMKGRCLNPNHDAYKNYGGRGITICERWLHSFENFLADMGERPENKSLDRKEVNGNYEPSNCRWATRKEQANNTRRVSG